MEDQLEHLHLTPSDLPSDLYSPEDGEDLEEDVPIYYNLGMYLNETPLSVFYFRISILT